MRILIGADTVPTESNSSYFSSGQIDALLGRDLREVMDSADFRLVNLEVPFASEAHPIKNVVLISLPTRLRFMVLRRWG